MILSQVLTAMKNKRQLQSSELTIFCGFASSFSVLNYGFWQVLVCGHHAGHWGWVTKPLSKALLPLSCTHAASFPQHPPPPFYNWEVALDMILPLTSSLIY